MHRHENRIRLIFVMKFSIHSKLTCPCIIIIILFSYIPEVDQQLGNLPDQHNKQTKSAANKNGIPWNKFLNMSHVHIQPAIRREFYSKISNYKLVNKPPLINFQITGLCIMIVGVVVQGAYHHFSNFIGKNLL